jgi:hypothetical protein
MRQGRLLLGLLTTALFWVGCTTAIVREVRDTPTGLNLHEGVAFVFSREFSLDSQPIKESKIVDCIGQAVRKAHPALRIVPPDEFRHTVFPDLAPEAAPNNPEHFALLLSHPTFKKRTASLGIRYLISLSGRTDSQQKGGVGCGGGMGGAACIGLLWWEQRSLLNATVFDLQHAQSAGNLHASADGRPWFFFVFPSPLMIGVPAFTESKACGDLGEAVAKFIAGEDTPEDRSTKDER